MTEFVGRRTGRTYRIGEQLDQDGQAVVHAVDPESSNLALKQFLPATLQKRPDLEARIQTMTANPPAYRTGPSQHVSCAWPEDAAYISGRFAGFVMPRVDTRDAVPIRAVATSPDKTWRDRVTVAENLARAVALLHDADVVIGDFRERSLLSWSDGRVTLLGCDRMQVVDPGSARQFPCLARGDGTTPPELLHASQWSTLRTSSSDIFSLAVQLHVLLLQGEHPFQGEWRGPGQRPEDHVLARDGLWSHAGDPRLRPVQDAAPLVVLPEKLQECFRAAFVDGARKPQDRPPAQQWLTELVRLRESLSTCRRDPSHVYGSHLPSCPWCPPAARPASAESPVPAGYTRPHRTAEPPAATEAAPDPAPTVPADPGGTDTRTGPAPLTAPTPSDGRRAPLPPSRRGSGSRVAAWAAVAVVGIGGVVGVASATSRSEPAATGPTTAASTGTAGAPTSPVASPQDPTAALEELRTRDAPVVETLAESWVAQLSARPAGTETPDRTTTDAAILAGHEGLRKQHPAAVLLSSTDWNYDGRLWVTVVNTRFSTAEEANAWCDTHGFAPRECYAKKLSHSGVVADSARYRG